LRTIPKAGRERDLGRQLRRCPAPDVKIPRALDNSSHQADDDSLLADCMDSRSRPPSSHEVSQSYFRRRLLSRVAFAATRRRYRRTISSAEAPVITLALALIAASIFSPIMSSASRRAVLPPSISFIILSPVTRFASTASIVRELNILYRRIATLPCCAIGPGGEPAPRSGGSDIRARNMQRERCG
jgi:hypothetical protein